MLSASPTLLKKRKKTMNCFVFFFLRLEEVYAALEEYFFAHSRNQISKMTLLGLHIGLSVMTCVIAKLGNFLNV